MGKYPLNQSAPKRAWEDTKKSFQSIKFFWGVEVVLMCGLAYVGTLLTPNNANRFILAAYPTLGAIIGAMVGFSIIYLVMIIIAPYKQRNEARMEVERLTHEKANDKRVKVIKQLKKTGLAFGHTQTDAYSFLTLIQGKLSVGMKPAEIVSFVTSQFNEESNASQIWEMVNSLLETWSLHDVIQDDKRTVANVRVSWQDIYWKLSYFGKQVVKYPQENIDAKT